MCQCCVKVISKLCQIYQSSVRFVSELWQTCDKDASQFSQWCLKIVSKLFQSCTKVVSKLSTCCIKILLKLYQSCRIDVSKLSRSCPEVVCDFPSYWSLWCSSVVHVVPHWCQVLSRLGWLLELEV